MITMGGNRQMAKVNEKSFGRRLAETVAIAVLATTAQYGATRLIRYLEETGKLGKV